MPGEAQITITGNLTGDPEVRQVGSSTVANFTVAQTPRVRQDDGTYADGEATFYRCSIWRDPANNVASSLHKGDRVVVFGTIASRSYEKDGEKKQSWEVQVEEVGPSLRFATATVTRGGGRSAPQSRAARAAQQAPAQQQWADTAGYDDQPF